MLADADRLTELGAIGALLRLARRAGLKLNDTQLALLCEVAPHAFAMAARIRRDHDWTDEPADVFRPPVSA